jgi:hypothetical protein
MEVSDMIVLLMALWSLCAIVITHLLHERRMKVASVAVAVLFLSVVLWTYFVFILDVADFGFKESHISYMMGSDIFRSFTDLRDLMSEMPLDLHIATASVAILVAAFVLLELIISSIRICQAVISHAKKLVKLNNGAIKLTNCVHARIRSVKKIYLLHCRLNN